MIEKHILIFIAVLFIIFLALIYVISSGKNFIESGEAYTADVNNNTDNIPVNSEEYDNTLTSVESGNLPDEDSNMVPDSELNEKATSGWKLVWNDEFNSNVINDKYWTLQTGENIWGNNELQYYTDRKENCYIKDGKLIITSLREKYGESDYTSARIATKDKFGFLYGKIEVRAKLPKGNGLLSAIWFLPCEETYYERTKNGEFDLVEMLGSNPQMIYGVVHYIYNNQTKSYKKYGDGITDYSEDFHVYSIERDSKEIKWLIDDKVYFTFNFNNTFDKNYDPFNKQFYLIINLAIGGDWPGYNLSKTAFPSSLEIDYVRYYTRSSYS